MGADDYVAKPFHPQELAARVKSQLRRYTMPGGHPLGMSGDEHHCKRPAHLSPIWTSTCSTPTASRCKLTATETKIVELLMRNRGRIFPAEEIYRQVWNEVRLLRTENTVMVHIRRIREKIELNPREPEYLKVVWGIGYKFEKH